jgi:transposase
MLAELEREHARLMLVREQLAALKKASGQMKLTAAAAEMANRRDQLFDLKSLGPAFSSKLVNEAFYKDFKNRGEVGGYFGLGGSPWRSGDTDREQGISKAGNRRARHAAIELAWLWLKHQPESALSRWYKQGAMGRRDRRDKLPAIAKPVFNARRRSRQLPRAGGMDGDRATLGPRPQSRFRRWVPSSWLPRRMHTEFGYGPMRSDRI